MRDCCLFGLTQACCFYYFFFAPAFLFYLSAGLTLLEADHGGSPKVLYEFFAITITCTGLASSSNTNFPFLHKIQLPDRRGPPLFILVPRDRPFLIASES